VTDFLDSHLDSDQDGPYIALAQLDKATDTASANVTAPLFGEKFDKIINRIDTADFEIHGYLRFLFLYNNSDVVSQESITKIKDALLNFKYWPDELADADSFGPDNMIMYTENHYILFAAAGYLSAQLMPDSVFTASGLTGDERKSIFRQRINKWMSLRYKTGFSEFLSNVYYPEDFLALLSLVDYAEDESMRVRAAMLADTLLFELSISQQQGATRTAHGRTNFQKTANSLVDSTGSLVWLVTNRGHYTVGNAAAITLVLSPNYRVPSAVCEAGTDQARYSTAAEQRTGAGAAALINVYGLDPTDLEDGLLFWTYGLYAAPETLGLTLKMLDAFRLWELPDFAPFKENAGTLRTLASSGTLADFAREYAWDLSRFYLTEANLYTYRTRDYVLASAQALRPGGGGFQELAWQAGLGGQAAVFTSHPGRRNVEGDYHGLQTESPSYWSGNGVLPRVIQRENVLFAIYDLETPTNGLLLDETLDFTHAYFPKSEFDEVEERFGWVFGRKGDAYIGLWSKEGYQWETKGMYADQELIAYGTKNIWICELGRKKDSGSFEKFMEAISDAFILVGRSAAMIPQDVLAREGLTGGTDGLAVVYESPRQGMMGVSYARNVLHKVGPAPSAGGPAPGLLATGSGLLLLGAATLTYGTAVAVTLPAAVLGMGVGAAVYNLLAGAPGSHRRIVESYAAHHYARYNNAYCYAPYPAAEVKVEAKYHWMFLNYETVHRYVSDYLEPRPRLDPDDRRGRPDPSPFVFGTTDEYVH